MQLPYTDVVENISYFQNILRLKLAQLKDRGICNFPGLKNTTYLILRQTCILTDSPVTTYLTFL